MENLMKHIIKFLCLNSLLIGSASLAMDSQDLRLAAMKGDCALVQSLIEANAPINAQDTTGQTALLEAAKWGHKDVCQLLIAHNAQTHTQDNSGWTPLRWAAFNRHRETCYLLIRETIKQKLDSMTEKYVKENINFLRKLPLTHHQRVGALHQINLYLYEQAKQVEQDILKQINKINHSNLQEELTKLAKEQLEIQLQQNVENALIAVNPTAKLRDAAARGKLEIIRKLVDAKVSVNTAWKNGYTPLHIAAVSGNRLLSQNFLDLGTGLDPETLKFAATKRQEVCQLLLDQNAHIEAKDTMGRTPLFWAAYCGHVDVCKLLLARNANPNTKSPGNNTALHWAAHFGHYEICQLLLDHNAQINAIATDTPNKTPFACAIRSGHIEICKLFIKTIIDRSISRNTLVALLGIKKFNRSPLTRLVDRNIMASIAHQAWHIAFKQKDIQELYFQINTITNDVLRFELYTYAQELLAGTMDQITAPK